MPRQAPGGFLPGAWTPAPAGMPGRRYKARHSIQVHQRYTTKVLTCNLPFANVLIALCFRVLYRFLV
jgi:hypothetical protein